MANKRKYESPCGRNESYIMICGKMFLSDAYRDLSPASRSLLNEFLMIYRPDRNGYLSISSRNASKLLNIGQDAVTSAFRSLEAHGFIQLTMNDVYSQRLAREWRLTFREAYGKNPTHDWRKWDKENPYPVTVKKRMKRKNKINSSIPQNTTVCSDPRYTNEQNVIREVSRIA